MCVNKPLYDLKQSPRQWNMRLYDFMARLEFQRSKLIIVCISNLSLEIHL